MSLFSVLFATRGPDPRGLAAICRHPALAVVCRGLREQQLYAHWPGVPVQAAPALVLLLSAYGLRRGRRLAWWLAAVINLTVLAAGIRVGYAAGSHPGAHTAGLPREAILLPAVTLIVLLVTRRRFDQTADRRTARKLTVTVTAALGASCGAFLLAGYLLRDQAGPRPQVGGLVQDLPAWFLPGRLFSIRFLPQDLAGRVLCTWVFVLFWTVVLGALTAFFLRTRTYRDADTADRARAILTHGGSTLSYMSTWPGNKYWVSTDGRAAIAYRAIAGVAVTVGGPYGDQAAAGSAIAEFAGFCEDRGLRPCLYGVTGQARAAAQRLGWTSVQIAEDTRLPLERLQFSGKKWQDVRTALNKAAKEGITAEWWSYPEAPLELAGQIRQISRKWVADKGLPEMGFTLGGLDELNDPEIRCLIAVDADRKVHGITSWMPVYASGQRRLDTRLHAQEHRARRIPRCDGVPDRDGGADLPGGGGELRQPLRRATGPAGPRRAAERAAAPARHDRHHHGAGVRLPVAAALQGQVPAGLRAALPHLPGSGRARPDRHRDRSRLPAPPHFAAGAAPAHQTPPASDHGQPRLARSFRLCRASRGGNDGCEPAAAALGGNTGLPGPPLTRVTAAAAAVSPQATSVPG